MDRYKRSSVTPGDRNSDDASLSAEMLRSDFSGLVEIFDRHLHALCAEDGQARMHVAKAKAAAERGLRLSHDLIALVKTPD
jgi:hypothetical protein